MIEGFDPAKLAGLMPMTEEMAISHKKLRKQSKTDSLAAEEEVTDTSFLSQEASEELPKNKFEGFLKTAKSDIMKLDGNSEKFLQEATARLVSSALEREFGQEITRDSGYPQMKESLTRRIAANPKYREIVENFLTTLQLSIEEESGGQSQQ